MAAHILGTIVAYTVYIKLSSLGDGYDPKDFQGFNGDVREYGTTLIVHGIYSYFGNFLPGFLTPMALGLVVAITTWHAFRDVYKQINRKLFWACNLFPHFLVWSGSSSKEQIIIIAGIVVIDFAAKRLFASSKLTINFIFVLKSYVLAKPSVVSKFRDEVHFEIRRNFIDFYNSEYDFYKVKVDNVEGFVNTNFKAFNGKLYRSGADLLSGAMTLGLASSGFESENKKLLGMLGDASIDSFRIE